MKDKIEFTHRHNGFTLVELLVATFLFLLLSTMLLAIVRNVISTWEYTEGKNLLHSDARKIFAYLKEDLAAIFTGGAPYHDTPMLLSRDEKGLQKLCFIKRLSAEARNPIFYDAGSVPANAKDGGYDNYYYFTHSTKKLLAPGGLGEVVYLLLPGQTNLELWRGVRTPVAGDTSFFADGSLKSPDLVKNACHKLSSQVLYLGFKCWGPQTKTWDTLRRGGPSTIWDSSCRKLPQFYLYQKSSPLKPVYPSKVQIELVLAGKHTASARLSEALDSTVQTISLKGDRNFHQPFPGETVAVKIGDEWISYTDCENGELRGVSRGFFGSKASPHPANTQVLGGQYFTTVVALPAYKNPWKK